MKRQGYWAGVWNEQEHYMILFRLREGFMSINRAEKRTIWVALAAFSGFTGVQLIRGALNELSDTQAILIAHTIFEYFNFSICMAVQLLGWFFFVKSMSRHRLLTAGLYTVVGLLDLLHALAYFGMPLYRETGDSTYLVLYGGLSQLLGASGLFLIFMRDDAKIEAGGRLKHFGFSIVIGLAAAFTVPLGAELGWFAGRSMELLRWMYLIVTLGGYAGTIAVILYRHRSEKPQAMLTIIQALMWLIFANLQFFLADSLTDTDMLLGQVYKLAGYFFLMRGIYYVTIEEPLKLQKQTEAKMNYMAYHDELTALGNRRLLTERLTAELNRAERNGKQLAVILLDIDRFKTINDSLGHSFGDQMLRLVAERLRSAVEKPNQVFRMGGDEFTIVLTDLKTEGGAAAEVELIMRAFHTPIRLESAEYHITVSAGISLYPADGDSVDLLVKNADTAMYTAKTDGNAFRVYATDMSLRAEERLRMENDLRKALELNQFELMYQPLVQLDSGKTVGVEALVRWRHPQRGLVLPGEFISITEENGLIIPLGEWVLHTACRQNKLWQDAGLPPLIMSVNLSTRQFRQPNLVDQISGILTETGLESRYLELEITESMTANVEYAISTLTRLKAIGVKISIDDFGTGYSSLAYLKKFPIDKLKIDRSFVTDLVTDGNDAAIVTTIATIAHHMNLKVTAEGVENSDQLAFLKEQKCEEAQGYYYSKPIPAAEFVKWHLGSVMGDEPDKVLQ
jgi:diguanylate cyclase (GGDEF)-like protein